MTGWQETVSVGERRAAAVLARLINARGVVDTAAFIEGARDYSPDPSVAATELDDDIERLRSFGLDITRDGPGSTTAAIGPSGWQHRPVTLDDEDLALLTRAMDLASPVDGPTAEAFSALTSPLECTEADTTISLSPRGSAARGRPEAYSRLHRLAGLLERRVTAGFGYPDSSGHDVPRQLQVAALGESRGVWYAVGFEPGSKSVRAFAVSRMRGPVAEVGTDAYDIPADFDAAEYLALSWRLGPDPFPATVRFHSDLAVFIRTMLVHIPLDMLEDGSLEATVTVGDVDDLVGWVTSFGTHARIVEPDALARVAKDTLEALAERHA